MLIAPGYSQLLIVDIQTRLIPHTQEQDALAFNTDRLIQAATHLAIPRTATEQYPTGLGHTLPQLRNQLGEQEIIEKIHFNAWREDSVRLRIAANGRKHIVLTGAEAHVCVLQTAEGLLADGYQVFVVEDACSSRVQQDKQVALARLHQSGAIIVSTEMVIFEWLERADSEQFKTLLPLVR